MSEVPLQPEHLEEHYYGVIRPDFARRWGRSVPNDFLDCFTLVHWVDHLEGDFLVDLLVECLIDGDYLGAKAIVERHGPLALEVEPVDSTMNRFVIPGVGKVTKDVTSIPCLKLLAGTSNAPAHFKLIMDIKAYGLIGFGTEQNVLGDRGKSWVEDIAQHQQQAEAIGRMLPVLREGVVERPELVAYLHERSEEFGTTWFDGILCWATPEMVAGHGMALKPFTSSITGTVGHRNYRSLEAPLCELTGDDLRRCMLYPATKLLPEPAEELRLAFLDGKMGYETRVTHLTFTLEPSGRPMSTDDYWLVTQFADSATKLGLAEEQVKGLILCRTTVAFLRSKQREGVTAQRLKQIRDALLGYLPYMNGVFAAPDNDKVQHPSQSKWTKCLALDRVLSEFIKTPAQFEGFAAVAPKDLFQGMCELERYSCNSPQLICALARDYGFDVAGVDLTIFVPKDGPVIDETLRFPPGLMITVNGVAGKERLSEVHELLPGLCPESVRIEGMLPSIQPAELLDRMAGHIHGLLNHSPWIAMSAHAKRLGAATFVPLVKTAAQSEALIKMFGAGPFLEHLADLHETMQTQLCASEFDL
ncbi:hypothetical protein HNP46_006379 [Pseudomonas nitritireducens]|uniref:Uncharacterized protein n=1 Tax=Pseudomonas nitroreducens TaxID=46680 RepID=A0A7W7KRP0_PSENT|nr:hypothetical protein [Pseudomonas nitritireducens]MBB4867466.1 hypothetical protein [Pseudomonas nitritireducens]